MPMHASSPEPLPCPCICLLALIFSKLQSLYEFSASSLKNSAHPHGGSGHAGRQACQPPPPPRRHRSGAAAAHVVVNEVIELVVVVGLAQHGLG